MNRNWRTNLGGAISVFGTSLVAVGVMPQLGNMVDLEPWQREALWIVALIGFILSCLGRAIHAFFTPDIQSVDSKIQTAFVQALQMTATSIKTGDTDILTKSDVKPIKPTS